MPRASRAWLTLVVGATVVGAALFGVSYYEWQQSPPSNSLGPPACMVNTTCNPTQQYSLSWGEYWFLLTGIGGIVLCFGIVAGIAVAMDIHERRASEAIRLRHESEGRQN